jgi:hypothetical protein
MRNEANRPISELQTTMVPRFHLDKIFFAIPYLRVLTLADVQITNAPWSADCALRGRTRGEEMNNSVKKYAFRLLLLLTAMAPFVAQTSQAQLNSNTASVVITATLLETLTLTALPSAVALNLAPGGDSESSVPVVITTTWALGSNRTQVNVYGSFASSTIALTDGSGHNIPSVNVLGMVSTGVPTINAPFSQTSPFGAAGAGLKLVTQGVGLNNLTSTRSDNLILSINLEEGPTLPSGVYVGTLSIQAQAL